MINENVLKNLALYASKFKNNLPFKHVVIDNFLEEKAIDNLVNDFPLFDENKALNENTTIGLKSVNSNLASISPSYKEFYEYISSKVFLKQIEKVTGIPDLVLDERMYGGGTHESLHGGELDIHIDFNYDTVSGYHRRLNLLLYLNEKWEEGWGGAIEIVSNPLDFYNDKLTQKIYNCIKNRCLLFETNEHSWHGFKKITLPNEPGLSRKLISIYLYTKDRPEQEIVALHETFYFPYPPKLPDREEFSEARRLISKRDALLMSCYKKEIALSEKINLLEKKISSISKLISPITEGFVSLKNINGYYEDSWIEKDFECDFLANEDICSIKVYFLNPANKIGGIDLTINNSDCSYQISTEKLTVNFDVELPNGSMNKLRIKNNIDSSTEFDRRNFTLILEKIVFI